MEIDIFTFIIQIINFVILMVFLNKFLFSKVKKIMEERNRRITDMTKETERKLREAESARAEAEKAAAEIEIRRKQEIEKLNREIERMRTEMTEKVNSGISELRKNEQEILKREIAESKEELLEHCTLLAIKIAEKILKDVTGENIEDKITELFIIELEKHMPFEKVALRGRIEVKSTFELPIRDIKRIEQVFKNAGEVEILYTILENRRLPYIYTSIADAKIGAGFEKYFSEIENAINGQKDVK